MSEEEQLLYKTPSEILQEERERINKKIREKIRINRERNGSGWSDSLKSYFKDKEGSVYEIALQELEEEINKKEDVNR